jgi:hypothetical protein
VGPRLRGKPAKEYDPYHLGVVERLADDSKDRETQRIINRADADSHRETKSLFVKATIGAAIGVSILGAWITFNHQDSKVRELGVSLISAPIAGLFGVLAGMGLK